VDGQASVLQCQFQGCAPPLGQRVLLRQHLPPDDEFPALLHLTQLRRQALDEVLQPHCHVHKKSFWRTVRMAS